MDKFKAGERVVVASPDRETVDLSKLGTVIRSDQGYVIVQLDRVAEELAYLEVLLIKVVREMN